ncbi:MAG: efflux RND transporter periplasmic adaptor subunit [Bacteroidota bacterium]
MYIILLLAVTGCKQKHAQVQPATGKLYTCSMHPQIIQDQPGKCPICGMDLIPFEKGINVDADAIMLSDQQIQLGNIQVDTVGKGLIGDETVLTATLSIDETKTAIVSARVPGRIEKLYYKNQGDYVSKGTLLYELYSEELNTAKQEYLLSLEKQATLDRSIIDFTQLVIAAKNKLLLWGMSEAQIAELVKTKKASPRTSFYSTAGGYIISNEIHEGDYVASGAAVVKLVDLFTLWAEAQVYTSQLPGIDRSGKAIIRFPDIPGKEIAGVIQFVNPEINPDTRINLVRIAVVNTNGQLKPGMPAYVVLKNSQHKSLTLPTDAIIRNEKHSIVWLQTNKGTFKSVRVETGVESGDRVEIKSGLQPGDVVVVNGAYLINSEYIFKKGVAPSKMN